MIRHRWEWIFGTKATPGCWPCGLKGRAPMTLKQRRLALGRCHHCGALSRWEARGPNGGFVQTYNLPGDPLLWEDAVPICQRAA